MLGGSAPARPARFQFLNNDRIHTFFPLYESDVPVHDFIWNKAVEAIAQAFARRRRLVRRMPDLTLIGSSLVPT